MKDTDKQIKELWDVVLAKKQDIQVAEKPSWETNCVFSFQRGGNINTGFNIQTETDVVTLLQAVSFLYQQLEYWDTAREILDLPLIKFHWNNYSVDEWVKDIKTRVNKLKITEKKKELNTLESRLNAIISPELRAQLELDEIKKILGK